MMEFRNSARGSESKGSESKGAIVYCLEGIIIDTNMKQKAYGTLASSEMNTELVGKLKSLPWRASLLRHFEEGMRTTSEVHALIAIPYSGRKYSLGYLVPSRTDQG